MGGAAGNDIGLSVATDLTGNVFTTGYFDGTVDFGGGSLVGAGVDDIVVAKYSPTGTHLWSQRFGSTGSDNGNSVAVDASGNVLLTGFFSGTVDFGGGALVSAGGFDCVIAKYNSAGAHVWSQRFGSTSSDGGQAVATDASGNVYMTGYFNGTTDFGGAALTSAGLADIVAARYDPSGGHLWSERFGDTSSDFGNSIATNTSNSAFMIGTFLGTVDFGGGALVSAGSSDIVVAKYESNAAEARTCSRSPTSPTRSTRRPR